MSVFSSVQNTFLEKRLDNLQKEVLKLKTNQRYGLKNYQTFESNKINFTSRVYNFTDTSWGYTRTGTASSTNIFHLKFTGNKPKRVVQGGFRVEGVVTAVHGAVDVNVGDKINNFYDVGCRSFPGDEQNTVDFYVQIHGGSSYDDAPTGYFEFKGEMWAITTDVGKLETVETFDAQQYFPLGV